MPRRRRARGFTLVELLVVVSIVAVLVALLLPAVQKVREQANRLACSNNLRTIGQALYQYHLAHGHVPDNRAGYPNYSPFTALLPHLEHDGLFQKYQPKKDPFDPVNLPVSSQPLAVFLCPTMTIPPLAERPPGYASYVANLGSRYNWTIFPPLAALYGTPDGVFVPAEKVQFRDISDGLAHTIAVGEAGFQLEDWPTPGLTGGYTTWSFGYAVSTYGTAYNRLNHRKHTVSPVAASGLGAFRSDHPRGVNFLFADGSVRFIGDGINADARPEPLPLGGTNPNAAGRVFRALASRAGGEPAMTWED